MEPYLDLSLSIQPPSAQPPSPALNKVRQNIRQSEKSGDNNKIGWSVLPMAIDFRRRRNYTMAAETLEKARSLFIEEDNKFGLGVTLYELSLVNRELGRTTVALDYAFKAARLFEESHHILELGWAYENLSNLHFRLFHRSEILTYAQKARDIFEECQSVSGLAWNSSHLGRLYFDKGLFSRSEQNYLESIRLFSKISDKEGLSLAYLGYATVLANRYRPHDSIDSLVRARKLFADLDNKEGLASIYLVQASIKKMGGRTNEALLETQKAYKIFSSLRNTEGCGTCLFRMGQIYRERGQYVKAWQILRESFHIHTDGANIKGMGWSANELGKTYLDLDDPSRAKELFLKAKQWARQWEDGPLITEVEKNLTRIDIEEGLLHRAMERAQKTLELSQKTGSRESEIEILLEQARLALLMGETKTAKRRLNEAEALQEKFSLALFAPRIKNYQAETFFVDDNKEEAFRYWKDAYSLATKQHQKREAAEALIGMVQIEWNPEFIQELDRHVRALGSRKLKAKYLLLKSQVVWSQRGMVDNRLLNQSFRVMRSSNYAVLERQALMDLSYFYQRVGAEKEKGMIDEQSEDLLKKGPVDLYLVQPLALGAPSFRVSLAP